MIFELPPDATKSLAADPNFKVVHPEPGRTNLIYVNLTAGRVTADKTVREAISYILSHQFTPLPETLSGLGISSQAVTDVLNFRKA